jgi:formylmethanofuran dehydrogenase subunit B
LVQCWDVELKVAKLKVAVATKCRMGEKEKMLKDKKIPTQKIIDQSKCQTFNS